jgi:N-acetylglucosaminyl-diphospho-decaprenol L-rhamnosyltransferase
LRWSTITVTYNSESLVGAFSKTVKDFDNVVIVDNNSTDKTIARLREELPDATLLPQSTNKGFGPANNVGLHSLATGSLYALFLNPDCHITQNDIFKLISTLQERPDAGLVCPVIKQRHDERPRIKTKNYAIGYKGSQVTELPDEHIEKLPRLVENGCIDGACFMVDVAKFKSIGGFDDDIFMYFEEDDIGFRMAQQGFAILINTESTAIHAGGKSTTNTLRVKIRRAYHYRWSKYHLISKYDAPHRRLIKVIKDVVVAPIRCAWYALTFDKARLTTSLGWLLAALDGLLLTKFFRFL